MSFYRPLVIGIINDISFRNKDHGKRELTFSDIVLMNCLVLKIMYLNGQKMIGPGTEDTMV